jgi:hypothetical protein
MFDKLIRRLQPFEKGVRVPVQIPLDDDGYMDRRCPAESCESNFKVLFEDWRDKVRDDIVFCPICRAEAVSTEWNTPEQREYMDRVALSHLLGAVDEGLKESAKEFNRKYGSGGFISMTMSVKAARNPPPIPVESAEAMRQKFSCEQCGCRYSSIGAAFFCPACGHNSAPSAFEQTVETIRTMVAAIPAMRSALESGFNKDVAQDSVRHFIENGHGRLVGAFQRLAQALFLRLPNASTFPVHQNLFQNLTQSSDIWRAATGKGYDNLLARDALQELEKQFQARHLISHRDGLVDQKYIDRSGDTTYGVGQRIVVREQSVLRLAELVSKLATELRKLVP